MSNTIKIIIKKSEGAANAVEQDLQLKGFQTKLFKTRTVIWDSTDFGEQQDTVDNLNAEIFVVIGTI